MEIESQRSRRSRDELVRPASEPERLEQQLEGEPEKTQINHSLDHELAFQ
jgi:hypothetical protein